MTTQTDQLAMGHLDRALDADDPAKKNYYVRQALQALVIGESAPHR